MNAGPSLPDKRATCRQPERWCRSDLTRCAIAIAIAMSLTSCDKAPDDRPIAYRGEYHYDKEGAYLVQVGVDAKICVQGADMTPAIQPEFAATGGVSEVVVRGQLSKPGRYGHLGVCTYELGKAELLGVGERRERP